jgi:hypothetical protein
MTEVKVGQIWKDNDKRMSERWLRVVRVADGFAWCENVERHWAAWVATGKQTVLAVKRMRPTATGYALVKEAK